MGKGREKRKRMRRKREAKVDAQLIKTVEKYKARRAILGDYAVEAIQRAGITTAQIIHCTPNEDAPPPYTMGAIHYGTIQDGKFVELTRDEYDALPQPKGNVYVVGVEKQK